MKAAHDPHRCSVLIVDDDAEVREMLGLALAESGYRVLAASNGREALHVLRSSTDVCIVMLDVLMPVMDADAFRSVQLRDRSLRGIPIVAFSGMPGGAEKSRELGAAAFLRKPLDLDEVRDTVRRVDCRRHASGRGPIPPGT